jgi:hypothetical protein
MLLSAVLPVSAKTEQVADNDVAFSPYTITEDGVFVGCTVGQRRYALL